MKRLRRLIFFLITFLLVFCFIFAEARIKNIRTTLSKFTAENLASGAILKGIEEVINENRISYSDVTEIYRDEKGNVKSLVTDTAKLNAISNSVNRHVDSKINYINSYPVSFPVSSVLGIQILSGLGPKVKFYVTVTGSASTKFKNQFDSAGINQTRHQIILEVSVDAYVIFGKEIKKYNSQTNLCIAESIIVGLTPRSVHR